MTPFWMMTLAPIGYNKVFFSPPPENDFGEMGKDQIDKYVEYCASMNHNETMANVLDFAKEMNQRGVNKTFTSNLRKFEKKYDFHYGEI